jgi:hypothetical protein
VNKKLHQQLEEAYARIEMLIHIGGMVTGSDSLPDVIDELLQEDDDMLKHVFPDMPDFVKEVLDDRHERGPAFADWVRQEGKLGFVVQLATPVMKVEKNGGSAFSWGHYYTHWAYGETLEEAILLGLDWVAKRRQFEIQEAV